MELNLGGKGGVKGQPADLRGASQHASVAHIEEIMGIEVGSMHPIAWLMLREESEGVSREDIAKKLGVAQADADRLRESTTGKEGEESEECWNKGVIALRTIAIVNQRNIGSGWDAIEAIAVDKIAKQLGAMRGAGDLDQLLTFAVAANKAVRRSSGEAPGARTGIAIHAPGAGSVSLASGAIGTIRLNLAPAVQKQLQQPSRVIDAVANRPNIGGRTANLEMLSLKDTRELADLEEKRIGGMVFDLKEE
mgnify:CR=1 FL=1